MRFGFEETEGCSICYSQSYAAKTYTNAATFRFIIHMLYRFIIYNHATQEGYLVNTKIRLNLLETPET